MLENISLKPFNTFGINVEARYFSTFQSEEQLHEIISGKLFQSNKHLILGGGSNILLTKDINGIVLKNEIEGIELISEDEDHVFIKAGAGVNWHQFVLYCIYREYAGIENLALIPGCVGAAPIQNIGAYGVEIKDVFQSLEAVHIHQNKKIILTKNECAFGYRESVMKHKYKGELIITSVILKLNKKPNYNISYGAISQELENMGIKDLSIKAIAQAVMNIRNSKLPNPAVIGNAGSFFKNPEISLDKYNELKKANPSLSGYATSNQQMKIAAGWLIEQTGWKGFREGDAGCYDKQALVLVNYGSASGLDILRLSEKIIHAVQDKFDVKLDREVNIL